MASHEKQQPEAVLPTGRWTAYERGDDARFSILPSALVLPVAASALLDTTPAEQSISSQAHQKKLQLPKQAPGWDSGRSGLMFPRNDNL